MTVAARNTIRHDDVPAQLALIAQIRAEPFTGIRRALPRIRRPRPAPLPPTGSLFAFLPEQRRPPRPWDQPAAVEAAPAPVTWSLTPDETAEVEALVVGRRKGDADTKAACKRWDAWIADGRTPATETMRLPGVNARADIETLETRLGWSARVTYSDTKKNLGHGFLRRPDLDDDGMFFWETREAAVAYAVNRVWTAARGGEGSDRAQRAWARFATEMQEFLQRCGIDVTQPPAPSTKRILMTRERERERELGRIAEAEKAAPVVPEAECPAGAEPGIWRLCQGAIDPPSPLALKRKRLRIEREEAARAAAAAEVEAEPSAPEPEPAPDAMARLVASGIANEYIAGLGALRDPDAPWSPRSIGFPVRFHRVGGPFQPPTAPRIWELHLTTPACGDLPFVRRVEEVTGLKARWVEGAGGQWHHAVDLANDADWERLASSIEHTEPRFVADAVGLHVGNGELSAANGCRLLMAVGIPEPETRACPNIRPNPDGGLQTSLGGWEAIYAVEDGLIVPGNPKRHTRAQVTDAGWRSVGKEPPTKEALKAAPKAARC